MSPTTLVLNKTRFMLACMENLGYKNVGHPFDWDQYDVVANADGYKPACISIKAVFKWRSNGKNKQRTRHFDSWTNLTSFYEKLRCCKHSYSDEFFVDFSAIDVEYKVLDAYYEEVATGDWIEFYLAA